MLFNKYYYKIIKCRFLTNTETIFFFISSRPRKPKPVYEPAKKLEADNELPADDVYIISDYKQQQLDLMTSISRVKKYALLDFADEDAIVNLKLNFKSLSAGGKKKKKQVGCWFCVFV